MLAVAERFANLAAGGALPRTMRFVLFNAQEQGLIGSRAYARRSKARGEVIAAVWQMDMIGFNRDAPRAWELHAGFEASAAVETKSLALAMRRSLLVWPLLLTAATASSHPPKVQCVLVENAQIARQRVTKEGGFGRANYGHQITHGTRSVLAIRARQDGWRMAYIRGQRIHFLTFTFDAIAAECVPF